MTMMIKLRLDLHSAAGRAAMRAYLDALDAAVTEPQPGPLRTPDPEGEADPMRASVNRPSDAGNHVEGGIGSPGRGHCESVASSPAGEESGDFCPEDPDGLHFVGCGCDHDDGGDAEPVLIEGLAAETAVEGPDPNRAWTEELKLDVWRLRSAGVKAAEIGRRLNLRDTRVYMLLSDWSRGKRRPPVEPVGEEAPLPSANPYTDPTPPPEAAPEPCLVDVSGALVPVATKGGAVVVAARRPAQDEDMRTRRLEQMAEAEREKFVARSVGAVTHR